MGFYLYSIGLFDELMGGVTEVHYMIIWSAKKNWTNSKIYKIINNGRTKPLFIISLLKIEFVLLYLILIWLFSFFLNLYSLFVILLLCLSGSFEFTCSIVGSSPGIVPVNEVLIAWHFMTIFMHNLLWIIIIIIYCCLSCWSVFH